MTNENAAAFLAVHDGYLILTHRRPDGDTLGCAAALCHGLRRAGKTAYLLPNAETTRRYQPLVEPFYAPEGFVHETVVSVDLASFTLFPDNAVPFEKRVDLCIDHHPSNTHYAREECIDGSCAACGEILYEILCCLNGGIDVFEAEAIYTAVSTDTGCFSFANTTGNSFRVAGLTANAGARIAELNRKLFRTKSRARMAIEGMIYEGIRFAYGGAVAVITITREMMERAGATENDMDDIAAIPGGVEGVRVGITVKELKNGDCKVSVRTSPAVNANALCAKFGGGGHAMAAGCTTKMTVEQTVAALLDALRDDFPGTEQ